jgi:3-oxoacyl-[acyl-carrier protein] reductase
MGRMHLGLEGKVAAVAAASSGLGLACALELAREGAAVAICSRDENRVLAAAASIRASIERETSRTPAVLGVAADLAAAGGPEAFLRAAERELGPPAILVANCGGPRPGGPLSLGDDDWKAAFDVTFLSSVRLAGAAAPGMRDRGWGRIVFITSISVKQPIGDLAASTALRSGVVGFAKTLSDELAACGVTVNCVAPGSIRTARLESLLESRAAARGIGRERLEAELEAAIPARRFGRPEELAAAVAFLASERASYITGTVLAIDGGVVRSLT